MAEDIPKLRPAGVNRGPFVEPETKKARAVPGRTGDSSRDDGEAGISRLAPDIEEVAGSIVPWPNDAASALRH